MVYQDLEVFAMAGDVDGACSFYRIREPARVAQDHGFNVSVNVDIPTDAYVKPDNTVDIRSIGVSPDVLVVQRPLLSAFYYLFLYAQKKGIACVVEIDDDLVGTHQQNIAYRSVNPLYSSTESWDWLLRCCEIADLVICSSDELARIYAPHGRFRVLRNYIPEKDFRDKNPHDQLRVGWTGTLQTHPVDLDVMGSHVGAALYNYADDQNFYVVGDGVGVKEKVNVSGDVVATGWVPRNEYLETMNSHLDIGVVPLRIDRFNQCKSWLKSLEMSSQGIPSVVSPTMENRLLSSITGNPVASKPKDWQKHLKPLLTDRDYYLERSAAVQESVRHLTYENYVDGWMEAWSAAWDTRRSVDRTKHFLVR